MPAWDQRVRGIFVTVGRCWLARLAASSVSRKMTKKSNASRTQPRMPTVTGAFHPGVCAMSGWCVQFILLDVHGAHLFDGHAGPALILPGPF